MARRKRQTDGGKGQAGAAVQEGLYRVCRYHRQVCKSVNSCPLDPMPQDWGDWKRYNVKAQLCDRQGLNIPYRQFFKDSAGNRSVEVDAYGYVEELNKRAQKGSGEAGGLEGAGGGE